MKYTIYIMMVFVVFAAQVEEIRAAEAAPKLPEPVTDSDYYDASAADADKVELGRLLFFDKILSGNRNISCATCHHPSLASADGLALPFGEGATGLGQARRPGSSQADGVHGRVPRNSPAVFNLGAREFKRLFHDGRVETDPDRNYEGGFITPAKWKLPTGLDNVLAAQAMFPVTSPVEMAGNPGENEIADAIFENNAAGEGGAWQLLAERLQAIDEYVALFIRAYPDQVRDKGDITFVLAANAIAAFEAEEFRADQSPFDDYLRGDKDSLTPSEKSGMALFYGKAGCSTCHSGKFQTDQDFHAIAMPQIGPGKGDGYDGKFWRETGLNLALEDYGRGRVTYRAEDRYKFRTPSLRNVALTGPYGHAGAYSSLEDIVRHHLDPVRSLHNYDVESGALTPMENVLELTANGASFRQSWLSEQRRAGFQQSDSWVQRSDTLRRNIALANELSPIELDRQEIRDVLAFLESLTDRRAQSRDYKIPAAVPSGLDIVD
jgi:cytochrome c peroxidase